MLWTARSPANRVERIKNARNKRRSAPHILCGKRQVAKTSCCYRCLRSAIRRRQRRPVSNPEPWQLVSQPCMNRFEPERSVECDARSTDTDGHASPWSSDSAAEEEIDSVVVRSRFDVLAGEGANRPSEWSGARRPAEDIECCASNGAPARASCAPASRLRGRWITFLGPAMLSRLGSRCVTKPRKAMHGPGGTA